MAPTPPGMPGTPSPASNAPVPAADGDRAALRLGVWAGAVAIAGMVLSGPVRFLVVSATAPQPPWAGAANFVEHYQSIQAAPFFFAFLITIGFPALHAAVFLTSPPRSRPAALVSLALASAFAALISFNYIAQTTIVPGAVRQGGPGEAAIQLFAMTNPSSVCWAIEMYGYAILGVASLFAAPSFHGPGVHRASSALLIANGVVSVASAGATSHDSRWLMTTIGLVAFIAWNVLAVTMVAAMIASFRKRLRG
jgi:hypothetical protein